MLWYFINPTNTYDYFLDFSSMVRLELLINFDINLWDSIGIDFSAYFYKKNIFKKFEILMVYSWLKPKLLG